MDQFFGFYDIAGPSPEGSGTAWSRILPGDPAVPRDLSPTPGFAGLSTGASRAFGERGGAVVIDGAHGSPCEAATAASDDDRFTVSLLGTGSGGDAQRAADAIAAGHADTDAALCDRLAGARDMIREIVGDGFLCAVRDRRDETLAVLRSRDCPWPLFHFADAGRLWFGSHLPSLRRLPGAPRGVDGSALAFCLAFGFPPLDRSLFASIARLPEDAVLSAGPEGWRVDRLSPAPPPAALRETADPVSAVRSAVAEDIAVAVAGRTVALLGARDDPRIALLGEAALAAGAAHVVTVEPAELTSAERLIRTERIAAAEDEVFAVPALADLVAGAERAALVADLCLIPEGSTLLAGGAPRHARFADRFAETWGAHSRAARSKAFHGDRLFVRDLYFQELAIFDDAARLELSGPALTQWNVFAMADALGPDLEAATAATAAELAARRDAAFLSGGLVQPVVGAVSRLCAVPIRAPFLSSAVRVSAASMTAETRHRFRERIADWPTDDLAEKCAIDDPAGSFDTAVRDILDAPSLCANGVIGRAALSRIGEAEATEDIAARARLWALCCLEIWYRRVAEPLR